MMSIHSTRLLNVAREVLKELRRREDVDVEYLKELRETLDKMILDKHVLGLGLMETNR
jgi:hypothetical protein